MVSTEKQSFRSLLSRPNILLKNKECRMQRNKQNILKSVKLKLFFLDLWQIHEKYRVHKKNSAVFLEKYIFSIFLHIEFALIINFENFELRKKGLIPYCCTHIFQPVLKMTK